MESLLQNSNINTGNIHESTLPEIPPWTLIQPNVILNLTDISKKETQPAVFMEKYNTIKENFTNYTHIYTDGSKDGNRVGCAAILKIHI